MPFADEMISEDTALRLAEILDAVSGGSLVRRRREAGAPLASLTLRERVDVLTEELLDAVDGDYFALAGLVREARGVDGFSGWMIWPVTEALAASAVTDGGAEAFDDALNVLAELTGLLSSEFAIRRLLRHDLERTLAKALEWTTSQDHHIRRLASEGTRAYLPWAVRVPALITTAGITAPVLDALYRDPSDYVRRSVANHLNDLSRDHADLAVQIARRWLRCPDEQTGWVARHGLRTLIKRGNADALALQGYPAPADVLRVDGPQLNGRTVAVGDEIEFSAVIRNVSESGVRVMVDYIVHHLKSNGTQTPKVFKLKTALLGPGESLPIRRAHSFRPISTRRYYPGTHAISLQVNGRPFGCAEFALTET